MPFIGLLQRQIRGEKDAGKSGKGLKCRGAGRKLWRKGSPRRKSGGFRGNASRKEGDLYLHLS